LLIALYPPNLGRHGAPLGGLHSYVAQLGGLRLDGAITPSSDGSTGQFSQANRATLDMGLFNGH